MKKLKKWLISALLLSILQLNKGCQIDGVANWWLDLTVLDVDRGVFFQGATTDITGIQSAAHSGDDLNNGPYFNVTVENSEFILSLNENFANYEEYETSSSMTISVVFSCSAGTTWNVIFIVSITDTNNNAPVFTPQPNFDITITPPLPPGYLLTGCVSDINVRDIDLTTQSIEFAIEENEWFEIAYDETATTDVKNFQAVLRTKTFIRSLPEPVTLTISATDVDLTNDPPLTTTTTLRVEGSDEFVLPEEPVFSQTYYLATYTDTHTVTVDETIYLEQGYDDEVNFTLTGEYSEHFQLTRVDNSVTLSVTSQLPSAVIGEGGHVYLVVGAVREYTSGATATVVVQLPQGAGISFEEPHYAGTIVDNVLNAPNLVLSQGYEDGYNVTIEGAHASYFSSSQANNVISLLMSALDDSVIEDNSVIYLIVNVHTESGSATSVVSLEIVKDDISTPVFEKRIYSGNYNDTTATLILEDITLSQGYDDTVSFYIEGEHESYFNLSTSDNVVHVVLESVLPEELLDQNRDLLLSVVATKPRTVGASTVVSISLPAARELSFEHPTYAGLVEDGVLTIDTIFLSIGYGDDVQFTLAGDAASYFNIMNDGNAVSLQLATEVQNTTFDKTALVLTLTATADDSSQAVTVIVIEVEQDDTTTPVFSQLIYTGQYENSNVVVETISLSQGYDESVNFFLDGDQSAYFALVPNANSISLQLQSEIPEEIIFNEKVFVFNVRAEKTSTVGANAAVVIQFPTELIEPRILSFEKSSYVGILDENILNLEDIVLSTGFTENIVFELSGDHASYFSITNTSNVVNILVNEPLPQEIIEGNKFLVITIEARGTTETAEATIIIDINKDEIVEVAPVFNEPYYEGLYTISEGIQFTEPIYLEQGFDETVLFSLEGEHSSWFSVEQNGNSVSLIASSIPQEVLYQNRYLLFAIVASKTNSTGRAAITIDLPDELSRSLVSFEHSSYVGRIQNSSLYLDAITVLGDYSGVVFDISGAYSSYFGIVPNLNMLTVQMLEELPAEVILTENFIVLEIVAQSNETVDASTAVFLQIIRDSDPVVTPVFDKSYYTGTYSIDNGLNIDDTITLVQGYDDTVTFAIEGEDSEYFTITSIGNSVTLNLGDTDLSQFDRNQLIFSVVANKNGSLPGSAAVVIALTDSLQGDVLRFSQSNYHGSFDANGSLSLPTITLEEGYSEQVVFTLSGDTAQYFTLSNINNTVLVELSPEAPSEVISATTLFILTVEAALANGTAHTTLVIENIQDKENAEFEYPFYTGSYTESDGLIFEEDIRLIRGLEENTEFYLEGENSQWFTIEETSGINGTVNLILAEAIPAEVLASSQNLVFTLIASGQNGGDGKTAIVISLLDDYVPVTVLQFEQNHYIGEIENSTLSIENIVLSEGYSENVTFIINGEYAEHFQLVQEAEVLSLQYVTDLPNELILERSFITIEIEANAPLSVTAVTTVVIELKTEENETAILFSEEYYTGTYSIEGGLSLDSVVSLSQGYDEEVVLSLQGEHAQWFSLEQNGAVATISNSDVIPTEVLANNHNLVFTVAAAKSNEQVSSATVIIALTDDLSQAIIMKFERASYLGSINNGSVQLEDIVLSEGYSENVTFALSGELSSYFNFTAIGSTVTIELIDFDSISDQKFVILDVQASSPNAISADTAVVLDIVSGEVVSNVFDEPYYTGQYAEDSGLLLTPIPLVNGIDETIVFNIEGEYSSLFAATRNENSVQITLIDNIPSSILANEQNLILNLESQINGAYAGHTIIVILLLDDYSTATVLKFEQNSYAGTLNNQSLNMSQIVLSEGYSSNVTFSLLGEHSEHFSLGEDGNIIVLQIANEIPESVTEEYSIIVLEVEASAYQAISAYTTLILEIIQSENNTTSSMEFSEAYYLGHYSTSEGILFETTISLTQGYDDTVLFSLEGDNVDLFTISQDGNSAHITAASVLPTFDYMAFMVVANKPGNSGTAAGVFVVPAENNGTTAAREVFDKGLYAGLYQLGAVQHEAITLSGFENASLQISGAYAELFEAEVSSAGVVDVRAVSSATFSEDVAYVALELQADTAKAALVLDVVHTDVVTPPTVSFLSSSYEISVDVTRTGVVAYVEAVASNSEPLVYSLVLDNDHLDGRLYVNSAGEIILSSPADSGVYNFNVLATALVSHVSDSAAVRMTVQAVTVCGADNDLVVPPLIVLDRDEEEPHANLVPLNASSGCWYDMVNRWPLEQNWLYVDETGLHTTSIDREDESIAHMALSQIQVELVLICDNDTSTRMKRSTDAIPDYLGPYDYGNSNWILTETILYNSRRSMVNLIVNDINDNVPVFVGKENEPLIAGYPTTELLDIVEPHRLIQLQATDADIGINAELMYWSSSEQLAVAPTTGTVHVRDNYRDLVDGTIFSIHATDRLGEGLTGDINIAIRLLDEQHIAVVTVRDAFAEDEQSILSNLTNSIGYDIKSLGSVVISDEYNNDVTNTRQAVESRGASLKVFVYGVFNQNPVEVTQLIGDINSNEVVSLGVAKSISLTDYLVEREIYVVTNSGRDIGLLVATIVLSVILFILIVLIALWFLLRWKKLNTYEQFSDANSMASRIDETEAPKLEVLTRPKVDVGEIKRTERRLHEMLDAPIITEASRNVPSTTTQPDKVINIPADISNLPIVIQSIDKLKDGDDDDDDEFGERKVVRRKSVVTFNENVEKIIHLEDSGEADDKDSLHEVFRL